MPEGSFLYPRPDNEATWETVCIRAMACALGVGPFQKFKRRGQKQYGIDLIATDLAGKAVVVQCKLRNTDSGLTRKDAEADVEAAKGLIDDETGENVQVGRFVIATTDDVNDHTAWAASLSRKHIASGLFEVKVYAWCDFQTVLNCHPDLGAWYLGKLNQRTIHSTVPTPSPTFVPRKNITAKIHAALQANPERVVVRQAVARAMGGYGKTVAAILYADQYKDSYPGGRFFLPIESGDIAAALASLITPLRLSSANDPKADAALVSATLRDGEPSLLILDNIASRAAWEAMLDTGLVPRGNCRVLITTRDDKVAEKHDIAIGRLEPEEAREVYRLFCVDRATSAGDAPALPTADIADAITAWVGGLAVAVAAVAAFMKLNPDISWEEHWLGDGKGMVGLKNMPDIQLPDVLPEVAAQLGLEGKALEDHRRTLRVIDDAIKSLPAPERRAVDYAALLTPDMAPAIWLETLLEADAARGDGGAGDAADPLHLTLTKKPFSKASPARAVLEHLDALDILLPGGEGGKLLSLHRLWHARLNEPPHVAAADRGALLLSLAACAAARRVVIVGTNPDGTGGDVNNPAALTEPGLRWELAPLAALCASLWRAGYPGAAARVGVWLAGVLKHLGRFSEAAACLALSSETEAALEAAIGANELASCYSNLATIHRDQGDLPGARASVERAIAIKAKQFAPDHPTFAINYSNLALIQLDQGDLPGARASMEHAISIAAKHFAPDHPTFAISYSNLAMIQREQGDLPGARASMERAIAIDQKDFAPDHPTFATSYSNLAMIQQAQGDLPGARASMERAIAVGEKRLGIDHPLLATCYSNLAVIQQDQGDLTGARASMERAIAIDEKHFAPDHPNFATRYSNLAMVQKHEGDLPGARASTERAIDVMGKNYGPDHPRLAVALNNLAHIAVAEGKIPEAVELWSKTRDILLKVHGPGHPHTNDVAAMLQKYDPPGP